jgi:hypothetical protein
VWYAESQATFRSKNSPHLQGRRISRAGNQLESIGQALLSRWFLPLHFLQPWRWRRHLPKRRLTFSRLHGDISHKVELFNQSTCSAGVLEKLPDNRADEWKLLLIVFIRIKYLLWGFICINSLKSEIDSNNTSKVSFYLSESTLRLDCLILLREVLLSLLDNSSVKVPLSLLGSGSVETLPR